MKQLDETEQQLLRLFSEDNEIFQNAKIKISQADLFIQKYQKQVEENERISELKFELEKERTSVKKRNI